MGSRLMEFFDKAGRIGGIEARVALARYTAVTTLTAQATPDTPENIKRFEDALRRVEADFQATPAPTARPALAADQRQRLRTVVEELRARPGDLEQIIRRVTEAAARELNIARVSIWFYDATRTGIECRDLFERDAARHSAGIKLLAKDYPSYFATLERTRAIDAFDANADPRTSCFSASYLKPLGINSMLDIPIWHRNEMKGVLCHEHIGPKRLWKLEEADFGVDLANLVSQAL